MFMMSSSWTVRCFALCRTSWGPVVKLSRLTSIACEKVLIAAVLGVMVLGMVTGTFSRTGVRRKRNSGLKVLIGVDVG